MEPGVVSRSPFATNPPTQPTQMLTRTRTAFASAAHAAGNARSSNPSVNTKRRIPDNFFRDVDISHPSDFSVGFVVLFHHLQEGVIKSASRFGAAVSDRRNSPPDSGGVARRATGWLSSKAANIKSRSPPPPTPSSTEEGSIVMTDSHEPGAQHCE